VGAEAGPEELLRRREREKMRVTDVTDAFSYLLAYTDGNKLTLASRFGRPCDF
jgi:hypothetical protein